MSLPNISPPNCVLPAVSEDFSSSFKSLRAQGISTVSVPSPDISHLPTVRLSSCLVNLFGLSSFRGGPLL